MNPNANASLLTISRTILSVRESVSKNCSARYYPVIAFFSGLCFSLHNIFFVSAIKMGAKEGYFVSLLFPYFIGEGIFVLLTMLYRGLQSYANTGHFWTKKYSSYFYEIPNSGTREQFDKLAEDHNASIDSKEY